jgi:hypothetical protein
VKSEELRDTIANRFMSASLPSLSKIVESAGLMARDNTTGYIMNWTKNSVQEAPSPR